MDNTSARRFTAPPIDRTAAPDGQASQANDLSRVETPPSLWDVMQRQVDRAFAEFLGGDYPAPLPGAPVPGPPGTPPLSCDRDDH